MAYHFGEGPAVTNSLKDVKDALKNLMRGESEEDENSTQSNEDPTNDDPEYFCVEDTFLSSDIKIKVEEIGCLQFPLPEETIEKLIHFSSKAQFGRGEETVLDTNVRDTQVIPAHHLDVEIIEESLSNTLERIGIGLNINKYGTLVPHLHNMLIYRPGQFFKKHSDSPKEKNMVASLVVVLPVAHKGGDLIIHHNNKQHIFFGSKNLNFVKCVAFYSDCQHEVKKVTEGLRVSLTYNVILKPSFQIGTDVVVDDSLNNAVNSYFSLNSHPRKLVFLLNHSYSENNLRWELLKGTDRGAAFPLFVVAKNQNRVPCLALAKCVETCDADDETEVYDTSTQLYFWIDDNNLKIPEKEIYVHCQEVCYTMETRELFQPYSSEYSGPTGNEGETTDNWYQRACVVIWSSNWVFSSGFNLVLNELHQLTSCPENENIVIEKIDKAGSDFYNEFWSQDGVFQKLVDIAAYINDPGKTVQILSKYQKEVLDQNNIGRLLLLERKFDRETWENIMKSWTDQHVIWPISVEYALLFLKKYMEHPGKVDNSLIVDFILHKTVDKFIKTNHSSVKYSNPYYSWYGPSTSRTCNEYKYDRIDSKVMEQIIDLLQICLLAKQRQLLDKLVKYVTECKTFTPISVAELFFKVKGKFSTNEFPSFNIMKEFALANVTSQIPELRECSSNWYFDIKIPCKCKFCSPIQMFFHSKTQQKIVVPAGKDNRRHVYSQLNPLTSYPIKFHTERSGNPFKIIIEKGSNVQRDREKILCDLLELKKKLEEENNQIENVDQVIFLEPNNGLELVESEETPSKRSKLESE